MHTRISTCAVYCVCREVETELENGSDAPTEHLSSGSNAVAAALAALRAKLASRLQRTGGGPRARQRSSETRRLVDDAFYRLCSLVCDRCGRVRTEAVGQLVGFCIARIVLPICLIVSTSTIQSICI